MKVRHVEPSATSPTSHDRYHGSSPWPGEIDETGEDRRATESYLVAYTRWLLGAIDWSVTGWMATHRVRLIRLALGVTFFWFGGLKFFPGLSPAEDLVVSTAQALLAPVGLTVPGRPVIILLALWEIVIGLGFLLDQHRRAVMWMLILHMLSTALPLVLLPETVWTNAPYGLTLEGQYIVKNLVILAAVATVGATVHGGYRPWAPPEQAAPAEPDGLEEPLASQPASPAPRVWIVDEDGSLVATYELDGYYPDPAPSA